MFNSLVAIVAQVLSWMFVIGMLGCVFLAIQIAAYLFSVFLQKDQPEEIDPAARSSVVLII